MTRPSRRQSFPLYVTALLLFLSLSLTLRNQRTPAPASRAATSASAVRRKRDRPSGPGAIDRLAATVEDMTALMQAEAAPDSAGASHLLSPARKKRAIAMIMDEEELSDGELSYIPLIFRPQPEKNLTGSDVADEYLGYPEKRRAARAMWLRREISRVQGVEEE